MLPVTDFRKQNKNSNNLTGGIKVKILIVLTCTTGLLFFAQLVFANGLATDGHKLAQIETEIQKLEAENTTLKVTIAQESSLLALTQKAKDNGFIKPNISIP